MSKLVKPKKNVLIDTFEKAAEVPLDAAKKSAGEAARTFSFSDFLGLTDDGTTDAQKRASERMKHDIEEKTTQEQKEKGVNFTSLDAKRIEEEAKALEKARQDLFNLVKSDETKAIQAMRDEEERRRQEEIREHQRKEEERKQKEQANAQDSMPKGKERKSILGGGRKKAQVGQSFEHKAHKGK